MTRIPLADRIQYELGEIELARSSCMVAEARMLHALSHNQLQDAMEAAREAAISARQLHTMLAHLETVIGAEIQPNDDDYEDSEQVYEGKVA